MDVAPRPAWRRALACLIAWLCLSMAPLWAAEPVSLDMQLRLLPGERRLEGSALLKLPASADRRLVIRRSARLASLTVDGQAMRLKRWWRGDLEIRAIPDGARTVEVSWQLDLASTPENTTHRETLGSNGPTAGPAGSFLPAGSYWYPSLQVGQDDQMQRWRVTIEVPTGQRAIVPGRLVEDDADVSRVRTIYRMDVPATGIDLMAGPYVVAERAIESVDGRSLKLRTLFHPRIADLSSDYLDALGRYFKRYEEWIGPYPYDDFSIVSSPTPTGFGMPSLTYLGVDVLRLPFIRDTSLGHEVLHNWWGNGVYPAYGRGNWSEGLTTFMADYTYALDASPDKARDMRVGWLRDLSAIPAGEALALRRFTSRRHGVSAAIGYGKSAMLFVMLRDRIGQAAFDRAIRRFWRQHRFQVADWSQLRAAFEAEAGQALDRFFAQWLDARDLPELRLQAVGDTPKLSQGTGRFDLDVPVRLSSATGNTQRAIHLAGRDVAIPVTPDTTRLTLDPEFRVLRRLGAAEAAPVLREINLAGRASLLLLGDADFATAGATLADRLLDRPARRLPDTAAPGNAPLLVIGPAAAIDAWLLRHAQAPRPANLAERGDVQAWAARLPNGKPMMVVSGASAAAIEAATRPLPHLGPYGWVVIEAGRTVDKGQAESHPQGLALSPRAAQAR
ncbi:MAG: M1 family peptidase [Rhodocyclaceae bacterium]|nr:M1 family peptidase [Rhodocyclaceae bacterium]